MAQQRASGPAVSIWRLGGLLQQYGIILPGATTLVPGLISVVIRERATSAAVEQAGTALPISRTGSSQLDGCCWGHSGWSACLSYWNQLKKGPVTVGGPAFNEALETLDNSDYEVLRPAGLKPESGLPAVRLRNLARYAPAWRSVFNICNRMSPQRKDGGSGCLRPCTGNSWRWTMPLDVAGHANAGRYHPRRTERPGRKTAPVAEGSGSGLHCALARRMCVRC
ncbi:hypothetical protein AB2G98_25185 (plasmid) [Escherichia coli]